MTYIKIKDGVAERYTFKQLRKDNPNVSFPAEPPKDTLAKLGVYFVADIPRPQEAEIKADEVAVKAAEPTEQPDGTYAWGWTVRKKTKAEKDDKDAKDAKDADGQAAARRVRGTATEADFIEAVKWVLRQ